MSETLVELWGQVGVVLDLEDVLEDVRKSRKNPCHLVPFEFAAGFDEFFLL